MLMSPMLMLRGISGRFMFFTAETARAGAADRPPCEERRQETPLDHLGDKKNFAAQRSTNASSVG